MKCPKCGSTDMYWKHLGRINAYLYCPQCGKEQYAIPAEEPENVQVYDITVPLGKLFEEIIVRHVALTELREVYRRHFRDIVAKNEQKQPI